MKKGVLVLKKVLAVLLALTILLCQGSILPAAAAGNVQDFSAARGKELTDPVQQALGEDATKAGALPTALQKKAEQGLSTLLTAALVLIGCSFVLALIKTAYGAIRGDGFVWAGALAVIISALCFVAVLHAKTLLYLVAQYTTAP